MDGVAIAATLGGIATIIGLFMKYISSRDKSQEKRDEIFVKALSENTGAMKKVATATQQAAREAKERNGHLAELSTENKQLIVDNNKNNLENNQRIFEAIAHLKNQSVDNQTVKNLTIKE